MAGGTPHYVRGNYKSFKGTNRTVVEGMHQLLSPAWYCSLFLQILVLGVVYKTIFGCVMQCVIALWCDIVNGSQDRRFQSIGVSM